MVQDRPITILTVADW